MWHIHKSSVQKFASKLKCCFLSSLASFAVKIKEFKLKHVILLYFNTKFENIKLCTFQNLNLGVICSKSLKCCAHFSLSYDILIKYILICKKNIYYYTYLPS